MTRLIVASAAVALIFATAASSPSRSNTLTASSADSAAVAAVVTRYHDALASGDSAGAVALLADDAIILESGGVESRAEYRSHHLASDIAFARAVKSVRGQLRVTIAGSTAWTWGTSIAQGTFNGRPINSNGAESMVLTRDAGGWRIRSIHWSSARRAASQ